MPQSDRTLQLVADELSAAVSSHDLARVETLLGELRGHDNTIDRGSGRSRAALVRNWQLLIAAHSGQRLLAEVLIEGGADPHTRNACGETALHRSGDGPERELLAHGADPGLRDHDGRSAADHALAEPGELSPDYSWIDAAKFCVK